MRLCCLGLAGLSTGEVLGWNGQVVNIDDSAAILINHAC